MDDTISRQMAIDLADYTDYPGLAIEDVKKVTDEVVKGLKRLPSIDAVQIVRCKDCKYHEQAYQGAIWCDTIEAFADENWFCATGERKES